MAVQVVELDLLVVVLTGTLEEAVVVALVELM
jgi:hypothetical protein